METANQTTRWSMLTLLHSAPSDTNWNWFMQRYRAYVAAVLRRCGFGPGQVEDAVAEFWGYLFQSRAIERAERTSRFRSFLGGVVRNFARERLRQQRRGQHEDTDGLAVVDGDEELGVWARHLLHLAMAELQAQNHDAAHALRRFYGLGDSPDEVRERANCSAIGAQLDRSGKAVEQLLHRGRQRLRGLFEAEVARTVGDPGDLREEIPLLLDALARNVPDIIPARPDHTSS